MRQTLGDLGYVVRYQKVAVGGRSSRNVIAERRGQAAAGSRQVVIVTAHLDSINLAGGASAPAPGADDNGSGSAGLLEMARVLAAAGRHDLRFILFGGEEQGLFGSRRYVQTLTAGERARIRAVVNMDMIGSLNSTTRSVLLEGAALAQRVLDGLARAAATYTALTVERSLKPFASDHVPFIDAGIPAVLTIEGSDNTNTAIHSERDTINRISYDFALEILRMNVAFVAEEVRAAS
jgi:Zn-dependent M28 family amino/carboxypeptidase